MQYVLSFLKSLPEGLSSRSDKAKVKKGKDNTSSPFVCRHLRLLLLPKKERYKERPHC